MVGPAPIDEGYGSRDDVHCEGAAHQPARFSITTIRATILRSGRPQPHLPCAMWAAKDSLSQRSNASRLPHRDPRARNASSVLIGCGCDQAGSSVTPASSGRPTHPRGQAKYVRPRQSSDRRPPRELGAALRRAHDAVISTAFEHLPDPAWTRRDESRRIARSSPLPPVASSCDGCLIVDDAMERLPGRIRTRSS